MSTLPTGKFTIRSRHDLAPDGWTAELNRASDWKQATDADRVSFYAGYLVNGQRHQVGLIKDGVVDVYRLRVTPEGIDASMQGRDALALATDRTVNIRYAVLPAKEILEGSLDGVEVKEGAFTAQAIAADIASAIGLQLAWLCRDYVMKEDFDATGRPVDLIRQLVEPWSLFEPLKVDVYLRGDTIVCEPRTLPLAADPLLGQFFYKDARIRNLELGRQRVPYIRQIRLKGKAAADPATGFGPELAEVAPGVFVSVIGSGDATVTNESETNDAGGRVKSRVVEVVTYQTPDMVVKQVVKTTFVRQGTGPLVRISEETKTNAWSPVAYGPGGATSQPMLERSLVAVRGVKKGDPDRLFRKISEEETEYSYDSQRFLSVETTTVRELNLRTNTIEDRRQKTRKYRTEGPLFVKTEETTSRFDRETGQWVIQSRNESTAAGHRPGGVVFGGFTRGKNAGQDAQTDPFGSKPIELVVSISADPRAIDVEYSNLNLEAEDLQFIAAQAAAVSGLWEIEASWLGNAIPWIRRGSRIQFTGLPDENGDEIMLPAMLVFEGTLTHDEASEDPDQSTNMRAVGWEAGA